MASNVQQHQQKCIRQRQQNQQLQQQQQQNQRQHQQQQQHNQKHQHPRQTTKQQHQQQPQQHQQLQRRSNILVNQQYCCFKALAAAITPSSKLLHFGIVAILLQLLVLLGVSDVAQGEGNVGCHFVRTLCLEGSEVCYDDNIFGKCIPTTGVDVEDIEKTPLSEEQSRLLATMLEELQSNGLGWDHPYVQCRIQGTLFSLQRQTLLPPNLCANLAPENSDLNTGAALAFVRYTPPEEDYADELYYPPLKKESHGDSINTILHELQLQDRQLRHDPMELAHFGKLDARGLHVDEPNIMDAFVENERDRIQREQEAREAELETARRHALRDQMELYQMLAASEPDPQPYQRNQQQTAAAEIPEQIVESEPASPPVYVPDELVNESKELYFPEYYGAFKRTGGNARKHAAAVAAAEKPMQARSFFRELAATEQQQQQQQQNLVDEAASVLNPREYYNNAQVSPPLEAVLMPTYKRTTTTTNTDRSAENERKQMAFEDSLIRNSLTPFEEEAMLASNSYPHNNQKPQHKPVFTEGGLIYVPEYEDEEEVKKEKARELLANMLGFTRHERLDVKKPGPLIGPPPNELHELNKSKSIATNNIETSKEVLPANIKGSKQEASKKKKVIKDHSDEDHAPHTVDTEYAHVFVKNPIDSWSDGVRLVNELANILHMQGYFTYLTVQTHEVSFRVDSNNPEHKTASDIARFINENRGVKNNILRRLGVTVLNAGVGDKIKSDLNSGVSSSRIELAEQGPDVTHIMVYMFAGAGAAAVIVIFVTLILIKRHDKKRDKLGGLQTGIAGTESCSKDYQDLCRARMAGKGNTAEPAASGRITSLSKENDKPPSSRSSTSSWSEEPALTNMDISTGHMVLSYMEDHLRNKGRLQREWEALCRYEAEPSAREAAQQPQCVNLNRNGAPLPYDHSRVVLNHLANAEGLDYINASTITDHDPRTPAYVAAQGPLPTTLAHFWQMIWEQGAVVIVALCRLQENGEIACARYWPEEGAEVYHIYEVHLVSEHIWCDDYLVRSFYLKNLRTSETRTVTQFHFLSWPQGGVPAQAKALLDFRRKVNKSYRGRSCPIVVHGSSGAGRTGAYILLDLVLGRMNKGAREIDIAATLEHLRDQRASLVATRQQFEFVLMAVAEEVHAILKALPANQSNEKRDADAAKDTMVIKVEEEAASASGEQESGAEPAPASTSKTGTGSKTTSAEKDKATTEKVTAKETSKEKEGKTSTPAKTGAASSSAKKK